MIDLLAKEAYWEVVEDCLVKFHRKAKVAAREETRAFREQLETGSYPSGDTIFHEEPFDTACAIARTPEGDVEQLFNKSYSEYEKILNQRGW